MSPGVRSANAVEAFIITLYLTQCSALVPGTYLVEMRRRELLGAVRLEQSSSNCQAAAECKYPDRRTLIVFPLYAVLRLDSTNEPRALLLVPLAPVLVTALFRAIFNRLTPGAHKCSCVLTAGANTTAHSQLHRRGEWLACDC